eukprot:Opistho-2@92001
MPRVCFCLAHTDVSKTRNAANHTRHAPRACQKNRHKQAPHTMYTPHNSSQNKLQQSATHQSYAAVQLLAGALDASDGSDSRMAPRRLSNAVLSMVVRSPTTVGARSLMSASWRALGPDVGRSDRFPALISSRRDSSFSSEIPPPARASLTPGLADPRCKGTGFEAPRGGRGGSLPESSCAAVIVAPTVLICCCSCLFMARLSDEAPTATLRGAAADALPLAGTFVLARALPVVAAAASGDGPHTDRATRSTTNMAVAGSASSSWRMPARASSVRHSGGKTSASRSTSTDANSGRDAACWCQHLDASDTRPSGHPAGNAGLVPERTDVIISTNDRPSKGRFLDAISHSMTPYA